MYKPIYIAHKIESTIDDYGNEIPTYDDPISLGTLNYQPVTREEMYSFKQVYGEIGDKMIRLFLDAEDLGKIREFDVAYLYGATPEDEEINGSNANYEVRLVVPQNNKILVVFDEIVKESE